MESKDNETVAKVQQKSRVIFGTIDDAHSLLDLDARVYGSEWQVDIQYVHQLLAKNPHVYHVLKRGDRLLGYCALFPLTEFGYRQLFLGRITEEEIIDHVVPYKPGTDLYMYFSSIVLHPELTNPNQCLLRLVLHTRRFLSQLIRDGMKIRKFIAIVVSPEGKEMAEQFGLKPIGTHTEDGTTVPLYEASWEDIIEPLNMNGE